jgi:hypothetical protein
MSIPIRIWLNGQNQWRDRTSTPSASSMSHYSMNFKSILWRWNFAAVLNFSNHPWSFSRNWYGRISRTLDDKEEDAWMMHALCWYSWTGLLDILLSYWPIGKPIYAVSTYGTICLRKKFNCLLSSLCTVKCKCSIDAKVLLKLLRFVKIAWYLVLLEVYRAISGWSVSVFPDRSIGPG